MKSIENLKENIQIKQKTKKTVIKHMFFNEKYRKP